MVGALVLLSFSGACERVAPLPTSTPAALPISTVTPEDATRSLLGLLRVQLQAAARNDRAAVAKLRELTLDKLVATDDVVARLHRPGGVSEKERAQVLDTLVTSWAATLAYYADGLGLDQIQVHPTGPATREAAIDVPARGRDDSAIVRVFCRRGKDNEWRVTGLEFAPRPTTAPASSPASASASEAQASADRLFTRWRFVF
jgi:hypothetical protein